MLVSDIHASGNLRATTRYLGQTPHPGISHTQRVEGGKRDIGDAYSVQLQGLAWHGRQTGLTGKLRHPGPGGSDRLELRAGRQKGTEASRARPLLGCRPWGLREAGLGWEGPWAHRQRKDFSSRPLGNLPASCPPPRASLGQKHTPETAQLLDKASFANKSKQCAWHSRCRPRTGVLAGPAHGLHRDPRPSATGQSGRICAQALPRIQSPPGGASRKGLGVPHRPASPEKELNLFQIQTWGLSPSPPFLSLHELLTLSVSFL